MSVIKPVCRTCDGSGFVEPCFRGDAGPFFGLQCSDCEGRGYMDPATELKLLLETIYDVGC